MNCDPVEGTRTPTARGRSRSRTSPPVRVVLAGGGETSTAVLLDDDLVELLDRRLRRRLVEGDRAVLDQVDAIAGLEDVDVVVGDHDDRHPALCPQARDEVEDQRALLG